MEERISSSFRDPSGFLFVREGTLLRQVNRIYKQDYDLLFSSGLYEQLARKNYLVQHEEVEDDPLEPGTAYKVIRPEKVSFISYPYEWSFSQLRDAALVTLAIQKEALKAGMTLKDASAYNIQFQHGSPVLIDTLSFAKYVEGTPWVAYRQFCQHFLAPLALMSKTDIRLSQLLINNIDGIPLDLCSRLLPRATRLNFGLLTHIHFHSKTQSRYADTSAAEGTDQPAKQLAVTKNGLLEFLKAWSLPFRSFPSRSAARNGQIIILIPIIPKKRLRQKRRLSMILSIQLNPKRFWIWVPIPVFSARWRPQTLIVL